MTRLKPVESIQVIIPTEYPHGRDAIIVIDGKSLPVTNLVIAINGNRDEEVTFTVPPHLVQFHSVDIKLHREFQELLNECQNNPSP